MTAEGCPQQTRLDPPVGAGPPAAAIAWGQSCWLWKPSADARHRNDAACDRCLPGARQKWQPGSLSWRAGAVEGDVTPHCGLSLECHDHC